MLRIFILSALVLAGATLISTNAAHSKDNVSGNKYAIIIAVSHYDEEKFSLPLTANDASALANTLHQRGGFQIVPLYESKDEDAAQSAKTAPTKANIMAECQRVLEGCEPGDTVFLYFSGHGFPHPKDRNKTYLLPKDVDPKKVPDTFLETSWLRDQLSRCKATTKFFMIDACHAGGEKSADMMGDGISSHELVDGEMAGVVTLASCTKNQRSYFWEEKEMSLFSYWLNEGIKGHGDLNGDGEVTFNELDEYVNKNVSRTAKELKNVTQTPIRIIRSDVSGVPVVVKPRAVSLDVLLDDLAEQVAAAMRLHNVKRTGVLEFSTEIGGRALDRNRYGTFAAYCAEKLEECIKYRLPRRDGFKIVAREAVEKALRDKGIGPDNLFGNKISEAKIEFNNQPMESYVVGTIEGQKGGRVRFRCNLVAVDDVEKLTSPRGVAVLTESEWAMLGRSAAIPEAAPPSVVESEPTPVVSENVVVSNPADFLPPPNTPRLDYKPPVTEAIASINVERVEWIDETISRLPNPLLVRNRRFDVGIEIKQPDNRYGNRPLASRDNEMFVPMQQGDIYRIRLRNGYRNYVAARVLVDGLNTLPQKPLPKASKFRAIEEIDGMPPTSLSEIKAEVEVEENGKTETEVEAEVETAEEMAPRVNLETARYWLFPPNTTCQIGGFFEKVGSDAIGREFQVTEAPQALAAQKNFTEQIGIITVAYYSTKTIPPGSRGLRKRGALGTVAGETFSANVKTRDDLEIDQLLGVVQIRYAEPDFVGERPAPPANESPQRQSVRNRRGR